MTVLGDQPGISTSFRAAECAVNFEMRSGPGSGFVSGSFLTATDHPVVSNPDITLQVLLKHDSLKAVDGLAYKTLLTVGGCVDAHVLTCEVYTRAYTILVIRCRHN